MGADLWGAELGILLRNARATYKIPIETLGYYLVLTWVLPHLGVETKLPCTTAFLLLCRSTLFFFSCGLSCFISTFFVPLHFASLVLHNFDVFIQGDLP